MHSKTNKHTLVTLGCKPETLKTATAGYFIGRMPLHQVQTGIKKGSSTYHTYTNEPVYRRFSELTKQTMQACKSLSPKD